MSSSEEETEIIITKPKTSKRIKCPCGTTYYYSNRAQHFGTTRHKQNLPKKLKRQIQCLEEEIDELRDKIINLEEKMKKNPEDKKKINGKIQSLKEDLADYKNRKMEIREQLKSYCE